MHGRAQTGREPRKALPQQGRAGSIGGEALLLALLNTQMIQSSWGREINDCVAARRHTGGSTGVAGRGRTGTGVASGGGARTGELGAINVKRLLWPRGNLDRRQKGCGWR